MRLNLVGDFDLDAAERFLALYAERAGSELRVYYRGKSPDPGAMLTQALTEPYHLIKLPKDDGRLIFAPESLSE